MRFTNSISVALVILPSALAVSASLDARQNNKQGGGANNNDNGDPQKSLSMSERVI